MSPCNLKIIYLYIYQAFTTLANLEDSQISRSCDCDFSETSVHYKFTNAAAGKRFFKVLLQRIDFDSIIYIPFDSKASQKVLLEEELDDMDENLFCTLKSINEKYFDLPKTSFYEECHEDCLLSKLFKRSPDNEKSNVASFFIFSKILFERFNSKMISEYLVREKGDDNELIVGQICKVLECSRRILISQTTRLSTLQIIKESNADWTLYLCKNNKTLSFAINLVKEMLSNGKMLFIKDLNLDLGKLYKSGLNEFGIEILLMSKNGSLIKKTICLSSYITNHILMTIENIFNSWKSMEFDTKFSLISHRK